MDKKVLTDYLIGKQKEMYQWAYALTSDREEARDLLQSTILKILDSDNKCRDEANLAGWIYTVMRNLYLNECHRNSRLCRMSEQALEWVKNFSPDSSQTDSSDNCCDVREIHEAVEALDRTYKVPFSLYLSGYKYHEIAEEMGIPIGTVKSRIFVCRQRLQVALKDFKEK